jgi:hypothetical protein
MIERRSHPRVKASHPVLYFSDIFPRSRVSSTVDISLGGTRIETTPFSLISGEDLGLSIAIHPRVIKCRGKVVRVLEESDQRPTARVRFEAGLRFGGMSEWDRSYLGQYLSHLTEQQAISWKDAP